MSTSHTAVETAIAAARQRVVNEALTWLGTPYDDGQLVKGAGCDCFTLIAGVFSACGIYPADELGPYGRPKDMGFIGRDWWVNAKDDLYFLRVLRYAHKVLEQSCFYSLAAEPGNIVLTRVAPDCPRFNHGGIVLKWPRILHAVRPKVGATNAVACSFWAGRQIVVLDPFLKKFGT